MPAGHSSAPHGAGTSERRVNRVLGILICAAVVMLAMISLSVGLSGLMTPEHPGGPLRILGGLLGFFVIFGLTLFAAVRQK